MSAITVFAAFELPRGKTPEEVRTALAHCVEANDADPFKNERVIDSSVSAWASQQAEHTFCTSITHDPAKHQMQLVCVIPGLKSSIDWTDLVVFLHQAGEGQVWTVCFVWAKTQSDGQRSETSDPSEMDKIARALSMLPELLKRKLNH